MNDRRSSGAFLLKVEVDDAQTSKNIYLLSKSSLNHDAKDGYMEQNL
jgi:hypothetical protein